MALVATAGRRSARQVAPGPFMVFPVFAVGAGLRRNRKSLYFQRAWMVLPVGIEPTTSPLPRECSTTELRQRQGGQHIHNPPVIGKSGADGDLGSAFFVFNRAAIGAGRGDGNRLTGGDRVESGSDVIMRRLDIGEAGRGLVVDRAHVDDPAVAVDDHHIRGRTSIVEAADDTVWVEQEIGRRGLPVREIGLGFGWGHIALLAGSRGGDRQPRDTGRGVFALQRLHVAAVVMLADERAAVIGPFEHDRLPRIVGEADGLAGNIGSTEGGRRLADRCRRGGRHSRRPLNGEGANRSECRYRRGLYRSAHKILYWI